MVDTLSLFTVRIASFSDVLFILVQALIPCPHSLSSYRVEVVLRSGWNAKE